MENNLAKSNNDALIDEIANWLMDQALGRIELPELAKQCFNRLLGAGIPLFRAHIAFETLHPLFGAVSIAWRRDGDIETNYHQSGQQDQAWLDSPLYWMIETLTTSFRRRLIGEEANIDFPVLQEFKDQGGTDYLSYIVPFGASRDDGGIIGSWLTDRPGGFTDREIKSLLRIQKRLGVACKVGIKEQISENIVNAYLGRSAGKQVMNGNIHRGDGEDIHAVIWFCDLRGSVKLANSMPRGDYLTVLNSFLECMAGAVMDSGGEVLRFVGDAALAIFPIVTSSADACQAALKAATDADDRIAALNASRQSTGDAPLNYGVGLHLGDVMYGNIGSPERIEFTVIGAAANLAARIEGQCKVLDTRVLISSAFAHQNGGELKSLGSHTLDGIEEPQELFTL